MKGAAVGKREPGGENREKTQSKGMDSGGNPGVEGGKGREREIDVEQLCGARAPCSLAERFLSIMGGSPFEEERGAKISFLRNLLPAQEESRETAIILSSR